MQTLIAPFFNFTALVALLVYLLREPLKNFVSQRHSFLRDELQRVRQLLKGAQEQFDEFSAKLKAIDAEVVALRERNHQDAAAAKSRLASEAQRLSATIVSDARLSAQSLFSDLKEELQHELVTQVIARAEKILRERLTGEDRARLRQEFSNQVESVR